MSHRQGTRLKNSPVKGEPPISVPAAPRCDFQIIQKDPEVLYFIQETLGFGGVKPFTKKNGKVYYQYYTGSIENITRLLALFNGNLVLAKRREKFEKTLAFFQDKAMLKKPMVLKPWRMEPSLEHAWLTGLLEADGGFYTNVLQNFIDSLSNAPKFVARMYITQKSEQEILEKIQGLFGSTSVITSFTNAYTDVLYDRMDIASIECREKIVAYLTTFPFVGTKQASYFQWLRVHEYTKLQLKPSLSDAKKLAELISAISADHLTIDDQALVQQILDHPRQRYSRSRSVANDSPLLPSQSEQSITEGKE